MVARLHRRSFSGGAADIRIQRWNGSAWVNYLSSSGPGASKLVDTKANSAGQYRIQIYTSSQVGVPTRGIFDVVPATCTGLDTCFGASGKNCMGFPNGSCSEQSDGQYRCDITVGANMHDSCCSANPNGSNCGGNGSAICTAPVGSSYKNPYTCCQAEWDHAVGDAAAFRLHKALMDPVKTGYRRTTLATTVVVGGKVTAKPLPASGANPGAIKAPAGTKLWLPDAQQGWCVSGDLRLRAAGATRRASDLRLLAEGGETTPRRRQRKHPPYRRPEPMANAPNQTWTWDITLLRGPHRGSYYRLYVVLDLFSRYTVGWLLARTENGSSPPASCATPARRRVSNSLNSSSTPTAALRRLHCPSPIC
jgi:hypothetical protein